MTIKIYNQELILNKINNHQIIISIIILLKTGYNFWINSETKIKYWNLMSLRTSNKKINLKISYNKQIIIIQLLKKKLNKAPLLQIKII